MQGSSANDLILALALGSVHRRIGAGEQAVQSLVFVCQSGQPLADGHAIGLVVMAETQSLDFPLQPLGNLFGHLSGAAGEHGGEFLSPYAPELIAPA
ncbi:hypothetical protein WR25_22717 [Diploscapter pachys]|uniref:Uncharacterized protein n=1 Tax=Diploscapter pachys TaxID=2018661 RepID=A0A2A2KIS8_9BILA|nr:hypothetical protein WR25_22717 [Diploscapter pachys]